MKIYSIAMFPKQQFHFKSCTSHRRGGPVADTQHWWSSWSFAFIWPADINIIAIDFNIHVWSALWIFGCKHQVFGYQKPQTVWRLSDGGWWFGFHVSLEYITSFLWTRLALNVKAYSVGSVYLRLKLWLKWFEYCISAFAAGWKK